MKKQIDLSVSLHIEQEAHKLIKVRAHKRNCNGKVVRVWPPFAEIPRLRSE